MMTQEIFSNFSVMIYEDMNRNVTECFNHDSNRTSLSHISNSTSSQSPSSSSSPFCPSIWDDFFCWSGVPSGHVAKVSCSRLFEVMEVPAPLDDDLFRDAFATRVCDSNSSWIFGNWTNYTACLQFLPSTPTSSSVTQFIVGLILFFGSLISLALLIVSLFIFSYFSSLMCTRLRVHRNLIMALIIHSALLVLISGPIVLGSHFPIRYIEHDWMCRGVLAVKLYSSMASINWMFVEGLLLHTKLSGVFTKEPPFVSYYIIGWGLPAVIIILWSSLMSNTLDSSCWNGYSKSNFVWLLTIPMFIALIANTIFLINIIRILVLKIKDSVSVEMRKALKATALLFPLLGINNLLFCVNPRDENQLEDAYLIINSLLQSSQGMLVSILYCFTNTEVKDTMKAAYCRYLMARSIATNHHSHYNHNHHQDQENTFESTSCPQLKNNNFDKRTETLL